jgi:electron transfer flavoprotein-quinone oxidoreductase
MYGGVIYPRILDEIVPHWWESAPIDRFVTRRVTQVLDGDRSVAVDVRCARWGEPPYNGVTAYRSQWDAWLAGLAVDAGATLLTSTTATGLVRTSGRVSGVATDRPDGEIAAELVVAADGANSFLAREAGLFRRFDATHFTLGVKEVIGLSRTEIESRFALADREGYDAEMVGATGSVPGGGFLYTNLESIAVGVVLSLPELARAGVRPEALLADLKAHPAVAPLVRGGELLEYSAHLIPEGGLAAMPRLGCPGLVVTGDAAGLTLAAGLWLEGVNFAMASGLYAAQSFLASPERALAGYEQRMKDSFVLADHRRFAGAPTLIMGEFLQREQGPLLCDVAEAAFTVTNPAPKRGLVAIARAARTQRHVRWRDLLTSLWRALRVYG